MAAPFPQNGHGCNSFSLSITPLREVFNYGVGSFMGFIVTVPVLIAVFHNEIHDPILIPQPPAQGEEFGDGVGQDLIVLVVIDLHGRSVERPPNLLLAPLFHDSSLYPHTHPTITAPRTKDLLNTPPPLLYAHVVAQMTSEYS